MKRLLYLDDSNRISPPVYSTWVRSLSCSILFIGLLTKLLLPSIKEQETYYLAFYGCGLLLLFGMLLNSDDTQELQRTDLQPVGQLDRGIISRNLPPDMSPRGFSDFIYNLLRAVVSRRIAMHEVGYYAVGWYLCTLAYMLENAEPGSRAIGFGFGDSQVLAAMGSDLAGSAQATNADNIVTESILEAIDRSLYGYHANRPLVEVEASPNQVKLDNFGFPFDEIPDEYIDALSQTEIMTKVVFDPRAPQFEFEYRQIAAWLAQNGSHPFTREKLRIEDLVDDKALTEKIEKFVETQHPLVRSKWDCIFNHRFFVIPRHEEFDSSSQLDQMSKAVCWKSKLVG